MKCVRDDDGEACTHEVRDISEGGLCLFQSKHLDSIHQNEFRLSRSAPKGREEPEFLKLFVPIPQHDTDRDALCMLVGQVVWRGDDRVGVAFVAPAKESLDTIRAFIHDPRLALSVEV